MKNLYFTKERYDLSEVGRVKLNSKLNLSTSNKKTVLETEDIVAIIKKYVPDFMHIETGKHLDQKM